MKVALIYPEVYEIARFGERRKEFPPFGVLYLAAVVQHAGHDASIHKVSSGMECLDLRAYDVVGFSISASATYGLICRCRAISQINPDALLLAGGVHATLFPDCCLRDLDLDAVVVGDGEQTILALLDHLSAGAFASIPGIVYRSERQIRRSPARVSSLDLNSLPLPARHLLPASDLIMRNRLAGTEIPMAHVMFSRGCAFSCHFCAASLSSVQYRNPNNVRNELLHLKETFGIGGFAIIDDNFVINRRLVTSICDGISDLQLRWSALSRTDTVNCTLLRKMASAGCVEIKFGVESGSERLLRAMNKRTTVAQIRDAVRSASNVGIHVKAFVLHGFPGEDRESTQETISLLRELRSEISRVSLFRFVPLPGSYVYQHADQFRLRGTHLQPGWDGDWGKFHIHHNQRHWWGDKADFAELTASYNELDAFVTANWPHP